MHIEKFPNPQAVAEEVSKRLVSTVYGLLDTQERVRLVLAGGSTYRAVYGLLAEMPIPWSRLDLYFGDERFVPLEDDGSNFRMVKESLLDKLSVENRPRVYPMVTQATPEQSATTYAKLLPDHLDIVLLGVGPDGHTASLFPQAMPQLDPEAKVIVTEAELPPLVARITLTPRVINQADHIWLVATGKEKAAIMQRIITRDQSLPVTQIQPSQGEVQWFVDEAASQSIDCELA